MLYILLVQLDGKEETHGMFKTYTDALVYFNRKVTYFDPKYDEYTIKEVDPTKPGLLMVSYT